MRAEHEQTCYPVNLRAVFASELHSWQMNLRMWIIAADVEQWCGACSRALSHQPWIIMTARWPSERACLKADIDIKLMEILCQSTPGNSLIRQLIDFTSLPVVCLFNSFFSWSLDSFLAYDTNTKTSYAAESHGWTASKTPPHGWRFHHRRVETLRGRSLTCLWPIGLKLWFQVWYTVK